MVCTERGRRVRPTSIIPREAAWLARKRNSMDWAFSELRACFAGVSLGGFCGGEGRVWTDHDGLVGVGCLAMRFLCSLFV